MDEIKLNGFETHLHRVPIYYRYSLPTIQTAENFLEYSNTYTFIFSETHIKASIRITYVYVYMWHYVCHAVEQKRA